MIMERMSFGRFGTTFLDITKASLRVEKNLFSETNFHIFFFFWILAFAAAVIGNFEMEVGFSGGLMVKIILSEFGFGGSGGRRGRRYIYFFFNFFFSSFNLELWE